MRYRTYYCSRCDRPVEVAHFTAGIGSRCPYCGLIFAWATTEKEDDGVTTPKEAAPAGAVSR